MIRKAIREGRTEMNIRGNQIFFYWTTAVSGVVTLIACALWGDIGLAGMLIFFVGLALTLKTNLDERELQLTHKVQSLEMILVAAALGLIYVAFPAVNWFHAFIGLGLLARGVLGVVIFSRQ